MTEKMSHKRMIMSAGLTALLGIGMGLLALNCENTSSTRNPSQTTTTTQTRRSKGISTTTTEYPRESKFYAETENRESNTSRYSISQRGLDLIKRFEGFSPNVYIDINKPAIGYGHNFLPGENYTTITKEKAEELLRNDARKAEKAIQKHVRIKLSQNQYDALCSFVYNLGAGVLKDDFLNKLNSGRFDYVADNMLKYNKAGGKVSQGLVERRQAEREMFLRR